uniref:Uncharacterized protein n=1 Tax=Physcomitrium patens TaxID=3218 RepID=A0A2K1L4F5_PHYPA|nr:hypothetical protein PHYPA_003703 [Physcomitrium patens]
MQRKCAQLVSILCCCKCRAQQVLLRRSVNYIAINVCFFSLDAGMMHSLLNSNNTPQNCKFQCSVKSTRNKPHDQRTNNAIDIATYRI